MSKLPFGFDRAEESPGFLLWQTTMTWQRAIKKVLEFESISHAQFVILATLLWFEKQSTETTQVLISSWTKLDKMTVSNSLKELSKSSFIQRTEHKTDTRAKTVVLTDKGRTIIRKLVPKVEGVDGIFFGKISKSEREKLLQILGRLVNNEK